MAAAQPGQLRDLRLGESQAREDGVRVLGQQAPGLRGQRAALRSADELRADLALQERDLAGHGGLGEAQRGGRRGEGAVLQHRAQRGELADVQHALSLELD